MLRSPNRALLPPALLAGLVAAVALRVVLGGPDVAGSAPAGLAFAGCLAVLSAAAGVPTAWSARAVGAGLGGALLLCLPPLVHRLGGSAHRPAGGYLAWAGVVVVVAVAEEAFLRGALHDAVAALSGEVAALGVGAVAFALLHVPLYGWRVVPLDLAVGVWLGALRVVTGGWAAPATAHAVADSLAWWLV